MLEHETHTHKRIKRKFIANPVGRLYKIALVTMACLKVHVMRYLLKC